MASSGGAQQGQLGPCYQLCTVTQPTSALTHLRTRPHRYYCCQDTKGAHTTFCPAGPEGAEMASMGGENGLNANKGKVYETKARGTVVPSWV